MEITRSLAASLALVFTVDLTVPALPDGLNGRAAMPAEIHEPAVQVLGASTNQRLVVEWAVGRFESAGLQLPPIDVRFNETKAPCEGHLGLTFDTVGRSTVELCTGGDGRSVVDRLLTVHELAHAWINENVDQSARNGFVRLHGVSSWWDPDAEWHQQGVEWAAETIAAAVAHEGIGLLDEVTADPDAFRIGYRILTGLSVQEPVARITAAEGAAELKNRVAADRRPVPLQVAGAAGWSLDDLTQRWAQHSSVPWALGPWARGNGSSVATSSLTQNTHLIAITADGGIASITLVAGAGTEFDNHDTVLAWTILTERLRPARTVDPLEGLGRIGGEVRGVVYLQA